MKDVLLEIGLREKEADLYLLVARHKEIVASQIAKISNESRTHAYDTINSLIKRGLITYVVKNNTKCFKAVSPERLLDYLREKEEKIKEEERRVREIIPKLKEFQSKSKEEERIEVYEGKEGLKSILNDIVRQGENFVTWGATSKIKDYLPEFIIKKYLKEREKKKIRAKQLFTDFYGVLKSPLSENRKLPKEFASPTTTLVYGDKIAIWLWLEVPKVISIESKDLAKSYKKYFDLMWNSAASSRG